MAQAMGNGQWMTQAMDECLSFRSKSNKTNGNQKNYGKNGSNHGKNRLAWQKQTQPAKFQIATIMKHTRLVLVGLSWYKDHLYTDESNSNAIYISQGNPHNYHDQKTITLKEELKQSTDIRIIQNNQQIAQALVKALPKTLTTICFDCNTDHNIIPIIKQCVKLPNLSTIYLNQPSPQTFKTLYQELKQQQRKSQPLTLYIRNVDDQQVWTHLNHLCHQAFVKHLHIIGADILALQPTIIQHLSTLEIASTTGWGHLFPTIVQQIIKSPLKKLSLCYNLFLKQDMNTLFKALPQTSIRELRIRYMHHHMCDIVLGEHSNILTDALTKSFVHTIDAAVTPINRQLLEQNKTKEKDIKHFLIQKANIPKVIAQIITHYL
jgi:hypothetical protein